MMHLALVFLTALAAAPQERGSACATWQACRQEALQAAEQQDFERFHDLAWRAMQKGPRNDADLMRMLARAQSLSGRPGDALVMLQRLLALGVRTDAATSDDFRRVRALPGWDAFEKQLAAVPQPDAAPAASAAVSPEPATADVAPAAAARGRGAAPAPGRSGARASKPAVADEATPESTPRAGETAAAPPSAGDAGEALRFTTLSFTPAGLAYDRVSNRFIVGDHDARKLAVVDEASQRVANLAGAQSAGFGTIGGLEIDVREGDLWVVSSPSVEAGSGEETIASATLHKLQLISGRVLYAVALDPKQGPARFVDVAVTPRSSVLVLDAIGRRLFVMSPRARRLEVAARIDVTELSSVAPESETIVYVAHRDGLLRVDLQSRRSRAVTAAAGVSLRGLMRVRWHDDGLLAVQQAEDGTFRIVRLKLDAAGQRVSGVDVLDRDVRMTDPTAAVLAGDVFYYLAVSPAAVDAALRAETIIKRVTVK